MSVAEPNAIAESEPATEPFRRPFRKRVMHVVRRTHLYLGLFLLPWAVLYGVTAFLFNHPAAFADAPTTTFGAGELAGTSMEAPPKPAEVAAQVVAALNERANDGKPYSLVEPEKARYTRDFAFATVKADGREVSLLFDVNNPGGTVRSKSLVPAKPEEKAPFAIDPTKGDGPRGVKSASRAEALKLPDPLHERVRAAVPVVLERTGFPNGDVTVTSVPDLSFRVSDGAKTWTVTYNALTGTVSGTSADSAAPPEEMSTRRFLTRLHLAHGYPNDTGAKWFWALVVDAMAFVLLFWGLSGLFMWWQVKATRKLGFCVLLVSAVAATALGFGMHDVLTPK